MEGRRQRYRVEDPPLNVALELGDHVGEAVLVDLSIGGARVRVARGERAPAPVHTEARLILGGEGLPAPIWIGARTTRADLGEESLVYGLRFDDPARLVRLLTPEVLRLFNRRSAQRVSPGPGEPPILVTVEEDGWRRIAELVDLSTSGLALRIPPETLLKGQEVGLSLPLPGQPEALKLRGWVLGPRGADRVAMVLDYDGLPDPDGVYEALLAYVVRQQRAILERSATSAGGC